MSNPAEARQWRDWRTVHESGIIAPSTGQIAGDASGDFMRRLYRIATEAFDHFNNDDAWAIASHIALSVLMAMFPFFIVLTSLASLFDFRNLADEVAKFLLTTWPEEIAKPIALEIHNVLTTSHTGVLTLGAVLVGVLCVERGGEPAYRPQSRLRRDRTAALVRAAAGIDRLRAGRRGGDAGARHPDRARPAYCSARQSSSRRGCKRDRGHADGGALRRRERGAHHRPAGGAQMAAGRPPPVRRHHPGRILRRWCCGSPSASPSAAI